MSSEVSISTCPTIRPATSEADRELAYRLRFLVYVDEMHRHEPFADEVRRRIEEPCDRNAYIAIATDAAGDAVGTCRFTTFDAADPNATLYRTDLLAPVLRQKIGKVTKLMVRGDYRKTRLAIRLCVDMFRYALENEYSVVMIDANDHLLPLYERLGFILHAPAVAHPLYGTVTILRIEIQNLVRLETAGSPFAKLLREYRAGRSSLSLASWSLAS